MTPAVETRTMRLQPSRLHSPGFKRPAERGNPDWWVWAFGLRIGETFMPAGEQFRCLRCGNDMAIWHRQAWFHEGHQAPSQKLILACTACPHAIRRLVTRHEDLPKEVSFRERIAIRNAVAAAYRPPRNVITPPKLEAGISVSMRQVNSTSSQSVRPRLPTNRGLRPTDSEQSVYQPTAPANGVQRLCDGHHSS